MAQISIYHNRRLVMTMNWEEDWIDGEKLYSLAPREGTLYPVIGRRAKLDSPITMSDRCSTKIDREFLLET